MEYRIGSKSNLTARYISCDKVATTPEDSNNTVFNNGIPRGSSVSTPSSISSDTSLAYKLYKIPTKKPEKNITSENTNKAMEFITDLEMIEVCEPNIEPSRTTSRLQ